MSFLASDVMDGARVLLNDTNVSLYTNTVLTPHVRMANEDLEKSLLIFGVQVQRVKSAAIVVAANALTLTLPSDFLLPIELKERASGVTTDPWIDMTEQFFEPDNYTPSTILGYWAFRNNNINFPGATVARDVLLKYERQLAIVTGPNSPEDFILSRAFLERRTAELAARYTGMNPNFADELKITEVEPAKDDLMRMFVLNGQGIQFRRRRFSTGRVSIR